MKVKFWGTRGSIPTPYSEFMKYGGNTSCVELRTRENQIIILDAGTGIRRLGLKLLKESKIKEEEIGQIMDFVLPGEVSQSVIKLPPHLSFLKGDEPYIGTAHIFISHTHWDHIQGFPFFVPAFLAGKEFTIYSLYKVDHTLKDSFQGQMGYTYFPVMLEQLASKIEFVDIIEETFKVDNVVVKSRKLNHPQGALGYRITSGEVSIVYATDNESPREGIDKRLLELSENADLLIIDAQYTPEEYEKKKGWGHSTWEDAIRIAKEAGVRKLAIFHHDPEHNDEFLSKLEENTKKHFQNTIFAKEGDELIFPAFEETDFSTIDEQIKKESSKIQYKSHNNSLIFEFVEQIDTLQVDPVNIKNLISLKNYKKIIIDCSTISYINKNDILNLSLIVSDLKKAELPLEIKTSTTDVKELLQLTRFDKIATLI